MKFISENLTTFGLIFISLWLIYKEYRSGNSILTTKIINDFKLRNEQLESILSNERMASEQFKTDMNTIVTNYKTEITKLQASNDAKDKHNQDLKDLLLDKNPEVVNVLKEIRDSNKVNNESMGKVLGYQTEILEEWRDRSKKIDEASKEHKGDIIRLPAE